MTDHSLPSGAPPSPARGRVLRVKCGYNPNSSSIGTHVPTFLAFAAGAGLLTTLSLNLLATMGTTLRNRWGDKGDERSR